MRPLFIEPLDVWLFRDGKAFSAGSDHHARSLFPPLPSAMQGALRSHYLVQTGVSLTDPAAISTCVGTATDYRDLVLRGPFLRRENALFFPLPADVVATARDGKRFIQLSPQPTQADVVVGNATPMNHLLLPAPEINPQKFEPGYVSQAEFEKYLKGQVFEQTPTRDLFTREPRPGNAIDSGKQVTREGMLFLVDFIRTMPQVGLHVELEAGLTNLNAAGLLRLGGEGRAGRFVEKALDTPLPKPRIGNTRFKLVLLTQTYFAAGWQPEPGHWDDHFVGGKVKCVAAALHRYISVGGFDLTQPKDGHKPALRYVDAGSVYFFEIESGTPQLKHDWLCDPSPDNATLGQIGFGQVAVGSW